MKDKPNYYAILPAMVRYDKELKSSEKLLYAEITALANKEGYCWSTNNYFAELYDVTKVTVSNWISNLENKGYLQRQLIYKENSKEVLKRKLIPIKEKFNTPIKEKDNTPIKEKDNTPIKEKDKGNSTRSNSTRSNNTSNNKDREEAAPYQKIKKLYNNICGNELSSIRTISDRRRKHLRARWKEEGNLQVFEELFEKTINCDFLTGNNDRGWKADFDWLIKNQTNFNKVLEGKYDSGSKKSKQNEKDERLARIYQKYKDEEESVDVL